MQTASEHRNSLHRQTESASDRRRTQSRRRSVWELSAHRFPPIALILIFTVSCAFCGDCDLAYVDNSDAVCGPMIGMSELPQDAMCDMFDA